ncbi:MAG: glycogen debranching protein GlgX [Spirochaetia bacterium]
MEIRPGRTYPYGATYDGAGTNFAIFSELAEKVELCLFDDHGRETRVELPEVTGHCWHGYLPSIVVGQSYGYRVHGPWDPAKGHLCNPNKLLIDPYARSIQGDIVWNDAIFPHSGPDGAWKMNTKDSASFVPKSIVTNPFFDWTDDVKPRTPWNETVIYEMHAKGFSVINPDIPAEQRGTYSGLSHPAAIDYLKKLGVTAVELMPVHHFVHDGHLQEKGLRNYWGYNTIGFFAPHAEYAARQVAGSQVAEFKQMVKTLHNAGIEVILDVVYNHTAEGNHMGPMLSLKGIDNTAFYRVTEDAHYYMDYTGTGNSLNMQHPNVLQLIMDSLRYWIQEMHVDGFRFDLASTLARELHDVDRLSAFFDIIQQDPVISRVKLIAEPWDVGDGGYQVGNFPVGWSEWNGKYRDCIRDFWRGTDQQLGEFAYRMTGSSDLYENTGRRPYASINFVTAHDGFTLEDLVSYNEKHNEANGEDNQDGESHNSSWNCGVEGPTAESEVLSLRFRQKRNFLTTLFLSQGVPMLVSGDELGRTQGGNNNGYCQDNETSWVNWDDIDQELLGFTRGLIEFRRKHPVFRRRHWFQGRAVYGKGLEDLNWFTPDGLEMEDQYWNEGFAKSIGIFLNGKAFTSPDERGLRITDDSFYLIINAHYEDLNFALPDKVWGRRWKEILSTEHGFCEERKVYASGDELLVTSRTIKVLKRAE